MDIIGVRFPVFKMCSQSDLNMSVQAEKPDCKHESLPIVPCMILSSALTFLSAVSVCSIISPKPSTFVGRSTFCMAERLQIVCFVSGDKYFLKSDVN